MMRWQLRLRGTQYTTVKGNTTVSGVATGTIDNLPMGAYLILIEGGTHVYKPSAVNIVPTYNEETEEWVMDNPKVQVKSSPMPFDKTVNEDNNDGHEKDKSDQGAIGSTVNFALRAVCLSIRRMPLPNSTRSVILCPKG